MNTRLSALTGALAFFIVAATSPSAIAGLLSVTDVNPDPNIIEIFLTAKERDVTIGGANVHANVYNDEMAGAVPPASGGIPVQVINAKVGDLIICHFVNQLPGESASIHWHGIELDNDSDGTAVTQDAVLPGQSYTYQFRTFRPGLFWFHSHMMPGNTTFAGMYGAIIIQNNIESTPARPAILPAEADTYTLALSDIDFDAMGKVGRSFGGGTKTINELVELCHLWTEGDPGGDMTACNAATIPGGTVVVNGQKPDAGAQTPKFVVPSGKKIRLRILSEGLSRHFRLKLLNSADNKLYRIGGQGGLLDNVQLNGGVKGTWDTKYDVGEIALGSGDRADVIIVPSGNQGDIIQLVGNPLPDPFKISQSLPMNYPIAFFQISGTSSDTPPAAGDPILAGTAEDVENLKIASGVVPLVDPAPNGGSNDETIRLTTARPMMAHTSPSIDGFSSMLDSNMGNGDFMVVPHPPTARYAHVGDLLELSARNETNSVHPYHLHGFSMQPVRYTDNMGTTLFNFDYDEFVDTIDVYPGQTLVFRTRLDDRPKICDLSPSFPPGPVLAACTDSACGGVVGRWLFHCHIFSHAGLGMMGEVDVLPAAVVCPTLTTQASGTVSTGGSIHDTATLANGNNPTGQIIFQAFGPTDPACGGTPAFTSVVPVSGNGNYNSAAYAKTKGGSYRWIATYSGDANNSSVTTDCGDPNELVLVNGTSGDGSGTIAVPGGTAFFNIDIHTTGRKPRKSFSYSDPANHFSFKAITIFPVSFSGGHLHFCGTAKLKKRGPTFTFCVDVFDNGPGSLDQFSIMASNGYSASGTLTSGNIIIQ